MWKSFAPFRAWLLCTQAPGLCSSEHLLPSINRVQDNSLLFTQKLTGFVPVTLCKHMLVFSIPLKQCSHTSAVWPLCNQDTAHLPPSYGGHGTILDWKVTGCDQLKNIPLLSLATTFLHEARVTQWYLEDELYVFVFTYKHSEQEKLKAFREKKFFANLFPFYGCWESNSPRVILESSLLPLQKCFPIPFS